MQCGAVAAVLAVAAVAYTTAVQAQNLSGNKLLEDCTATGGSFRSGVCHGYIRALAEAFGPCAPTGVTYGQITDVVIKHLYDNPQSRHREAQELILNAMAQAWPCPARR